MIQELISAISQLQENEALNLTHQLIQDEIDPWDIMDACRDALVIIGERFERGESFIPELVYAGEILDQITKLVKPNLDHKQTQEKIGKIVIGTVQGDIHDIAKDIVVFMLDINGFEVHDLGVDVTPQAFVDKVNDVQADILGLSGFLTLAFDPMKKTVELLHSLGLEEKTKVMIGGGPVDEQARLYTGADAWGKDAITAVKLAKQWIQEN